jgi:hypothetical protein
MLEPQALSQESIIGKLFVTAECEGDWSEFVLKF